MRSRRWDKASLTLMGAMAGTLLAFAHEFHEMLEMMEAGEFDLDCFASILMKTSLGAALGALLVVGFTRLRKAWGAASATRRARRVEGGPSAVE